MKLASPKRGRSNIPATGQACSLPPNGPRWLVAGLFFLGYFFYTWWLNPTLQYHAFSPVFFTSAAFLKDFTGYPGGLVEYAAAFLMQFYLFPWLGALITTAIAGLLYQAAKQLLGKAGLEPARVLPFAPPILLLLLQQQYEYPWMAATLGLLLAMICSVVYIQLAASSSWVRWLAFWLLSMPLYFLAAGNYLWFGLLAGLFELLVGRRLWLGLAHLAVGALIPGLAAAFFFVLSWRDAYLLLLPVPGRLLPPVYAAALYLIPPLMLGGGVLYRAMLPGGFLGKGKIRWMTHPLLWLGVAAGLVGWSRDATAGRLILIDYYAQQKQWDKLLQVAAPLGRFHPAAVADINQALAHTGQLLDNLFAFPQKSGSDFWLHFHEEADSRKCLKMSRFLFELGQVNRAERMACEDLEINGYHPATLQQLFYIRVLKGDLGAARLFLNLLARTPWHRNWAARYQFELAADPRLSTDPTLQQARQVMLREDYIGEATTEPILQQALRQNRRNRLAFDFLMAYYLLNSQLDKLVLNLSRLRDFDLPSIPRHLEEALLLYQKLNPNQTLDLQGHRINPATADKYQRFHAKFMGYQGNLAAAQAGLATEFGDTYWFYYLFERSGSLAAAPVSGLNK